ncbi:hypothetical protein CF319_g7393 [Tilletia indica]|nr:hypothetical protein CF319_g7393 [Tilletia indica]
MRIGLPAEVIGTEASAPSTTPAVPTTSTAAEATTAPVRGGSSSATNLTEEDDSDVAALTAAFRHLRIEASDADDAMAVDLPPSSPEVETAEANGDPPGIGAARTMPRPSTHVAHQRACGKQWRSVGGAAAGEEGFRSISSAEQERSKPADSSVRGCDEEGPGPRNGMVWEMMMWSVGLESGY